MTEMSAHEPGTFCWTDLQTTDPDAARVFYSELFGWKMKTDELPDGGTYTMISVGDKAIGGLSAQPPTVPDGVPPAWNSYVAVASADDAVKTVEELGGNVLAPAFDVMDVGRMAVLADTTGAVFCVWQAKKHHGAEVKDVPSAMCWNELATSDADKAIAFYRGLFGWKADTKDDAVKYTEWMRDDNDKPAGGMLQMNEEWGDIPPHWMVYFSVTNTDETAERAKSLGGNIKVPPTDITKVGRFSVLQDPQGAVFSVIKLEHH